MKVVTVVGARPQFIKCAPVSRELRRENEEILVHTGQHYDHNMSDVFFQELRLPDPDYNLGIGSKAQGGQTAGILEKLEEVLIKEKPDIVLLYGDTNSTLAGALAAAKLHIDIAHVEAGLRSYDRRMPEEINRIVTDHVSDQLFCPTAAAIENLRKEGITEGVYRVGDVMADAIEYSRSIAGRRKGIAEGLGFRRGSYLAVTTHRPSNTDSRKNLTDIIRALGACGKDIVFPAHPRTVKYLAEYGLLDTLPPNIKIVEPLSYLDMLNLMDGAEMVVTDSGGVQKEAYMLGVPCVTLRENTEWVETLEGGWNVLAGADQAKILTAISESHRPENHPDIFGRGASKRIVDILKEWNEARITPAEEASKVDALI